jgi:hypothetical protein
LIFHFPALLLVFFTTIPGAAQFRRPKLVGELQDAPGAPSNYCLIDALADLELRNSGGRPWNSLNSPWADDRPESVKTMRVVS